MAAKFRAATAAAPTSAVRDYSVAIPSGTAHGDILIVHGEIDQGTVVNSTGGQEAVTPLDAGWSMLVDSRIYWRRWLSGDPTSFSFRHDAVGAAAVGMLAFSNCAANPAGFASAAVQTNAAGTNAPVNSTSPSQTATGGDLLVVLARAGHQTEGTVPTATTPSGMTLRSDRRLDTGQGRALSCVWDQSVGAGSTGGRTTGIGTGSTAAMQEQVAASLLLPNTAPSAPGAFVSPTSGEVVNTTDLVEHGGSTDADGDALTYDFDLSLDNGANWKAVRAKAAGVSFTYDYTSEAATTAAKWRSRAWDGAVYGPYRESPLFTVQHNTAPTAPTPTEPVGGAVKDRNGAIRLAATFNDPDAGDSVSRSRWRWRTVGATSWATTVTQDNNLRYYDIAAGTLTAADYEWQAEYTDASGAVSPWSASEFFTAATPPAGPTITAPLSGATVPQNDVIAWSSSDQAAFRVRRVADSAGSPDTATVYYDSGVVESATARNHPLTFETNNRYEHVQVQVRSAAGLWSVWDSERVLVSYTRPAAPAVTLTTDDGRGLIVVEVSNPAPGVGEPTVTSHEVWRRETARLGVGIRLKLGLAPGGAFGDYTPASGIDYEYQAVSVGDNGATAASGWTGAVSGVVTVLPDSGYEGGY